MSYWSKKLYHNDAVIFLERLKSVLRKGVDIAELSHGNRCAGLVELGGGSEDMAVSAPPAYEDSLGIGIAHHLKLRDVVGYAGHFLAAHVDHAFMVGAVGRGHRKVFSIPYRNPLMRQLKLTEQPTSRFLQGSICRYPNRLLSILR